MKHVASLFADEALNALEKYLGVSLSDEKDYTMDELSDLYDRITEEFPYQFNSDGTPAESGAMFEQLLDVFVKNKLIQTE